MTKSELIQRLGKKYPKMPISDVEKGVKIILDHISDTLGQGRRVEVRGFGSFSVRYREPKVGRNPRTGDAVELNGKYATHFRPGKSLRESVNESRNKYEIQ